MPKWAAVVVTYHRPEALQRAVAALRSQTIAPTAIVVVDNGGDAQPLDGVVIVDSGENLGYGGGLALGCEHVPPGVDFVLFCDDDSTAPADATERLLNVASSDEQIGIVGTQGGLLRWGRPIHNARHRLTPSTGVEVQDVDFTLVDYALVRCSAIDEVGPPDVDLFMAMEDIEFTTRVRSAGWRLVVVEGAVAREHLGSDSDWRRYYQVRNHALIARKHRSLIWWLGWGRRTCGMVFVAVRAREWAIVRLRLKGAWDGLRGVTGKTVRPQ